MRHTLPAFLLITCTCHTFDRAGGGAIWPLDFFCIVIPADLFVQPQINEVALDSLPLYVGPV